MYLILGFGTAGITAGKLLACPTSRLGWILTFDRLSIGSLAAAIHSMIGNVTAGSAFAIMQSLGATGMLASLIPLLGATCAVGIRGAVKSV